MLILDEPTNHLDVDAREALVQALNSYSGAVVLVSHDRHMLELTADRLVLVADGTAREFAGSLEDYTDLILGKNQPRSESAPKGTKKDRKAAAAEREQVQALRKEVRELEAVIAKLMAGRSAIDLAMFDPSKAEPLLSELTMGDLMKRRADVETALEEAESRWMEASEKLERQQAA